MVQLIHRRAIITTRSSYQEVSRVEDAAPLRSFQRLSLWIALWASSQTARSYRDSLVHRQSSRKVSRLRPDRLHVRTGSLAEHHRVICSDLRGSLSVCLCLSALNRGIPWVVWKMGNFGTSQTKLLAEIRWESFADVISTSQWVGARFRR